MRMATSTIALCLALIAGCGGPRFDGSSYRGDGFTLRVTGIPASWRRVDTSSGAVAFRDDAASATIAMNGRCRMDGEDVPLPSLTEHLFLQFTAQNTVSQELLPLDGREALHSIVDAKLDGVPHRFDVWVMKKDGCVYDFMFIAERERFEKGIEPFRNVVRGSSATASHGD
jgi:hypothetical protein